MMGDRNLETILDAVAEQIKSLKRDIMLKDMESDRLKERCKELEAENGELYKMLHGVVRKNVDSEVL